jgi:hypothetical protein
MSKFATGKDLKFQQPTRDPLQRQIEEREDIMKPEEIELFSRYGIEIPEGMKRSQVMKMFPILSRQIMSPYEEASLKERKEEGKRSERRIELSKLAEERKQEAEERRRLTKLWERKKLPATSMKEVSGINTTIDMAERLQDVYLDTGYEASRIQGRLDTWLTRWGLAGPTVSEIMGEIKAIQSQHGRFLSGLRLTDFEFRQIAQQLPQAYQRGDTFQTMLKRFLSELKTRRRNIYEPYRDAGYDMSGYRGSGEMRPQDEAYIGGTSSSGEAGGSQTWMVPGKGNIEVAPGELEDFLEQYKDAKRVD